MLAKIVRNERKPTVTCPVDLLVMYFYTKANKISKVNVITNNNLNVLPKSLLSLNDSLLNFDLRFLASESDNPRQ